MGLTNPGVVRISGSNQTFSGTVRITGGPNITVGTDASGLSMSAAAGGAGGLASAGFSTQGNTAGNTSMATSVMQLVGGNNITLSGGTAAGNVTITISGPNAQTAISGLAASNTTYTSGTVTITGVGGGITVSSNTGQRIDLSVAAQTVQTQGIESIGVSTGGNTSGNTTVNTGSRMVFVGSNGITLSQGTAAGASTITISGITQSVQTDGIVNMGVSTGGNTSGNTTVNSGSRMVFVGTNGITLSQGTAANASTITISGITQSVQTQDVLSIGVSTLGNTAGNTTVNTGSRLVFSGGNNITLSQDTAAGASTIRIDGPSPGAAQFSVGVSTGGNTSGNTGVTGTRIVFVGSNNITLSQANDATGATVTISGPSAGGFSAGASNLGNTAGSTGVTGTRLVIVGTHGINLSQSTDANGGTVTFYQPGPGFWANWPNGFADTQAIHTVSNTNQNTIWFSPMGQLAGPLVPKTIGIAMSGGTGTTARITIHAGFYTLTSSNGSPTLSLVSSTSNSYSQTASAQWQKPVRWEVTGLSNMTLTPTEEGWWFGYHIDATSGQVQPIGARTGFANFSGNIAAGADQSTTASQAKFLPGKGSFSSASLPNSAAMSAIGGNTGALAGTPFIIVSEIPITI